MIDGCLLEVAFGMDDVGMSEWDDDVGMSEWDG